MSSQYLGELSGYIIKDADHFVPCIKGIGIKKFYVLDDLKPGEAKDVGEDPCEEWCKPTYMFYTIRKIPKNASSPEDENIQVYAAGSLLMELKGAIGKDEHSVETKSVRCNDNSEIGDLKCTVEIEGNPVGTTEDDKRKKDELERWVVYQDPVGNVGYCFQKRFFTDETKRHEMWYEGEVIHVNNSTGKRNILL